MPNVIRLAGGGATAQVISLLAVPALTRLYDAAEFGVFSVFSSIVLVLTPISTLRFNSALMIAENNLRALALLRLSLMSVLVTSAIIAAIALYTYLTNASGVLGVWVLLIPVGMLIFGAMQSLQFWMIRQRCFSQVAVAQISGALGDRTTAIAAGALWGAGAGGLIGGRLVGPVLTMFFMMKAGISRFKGSAYNMESYRHRVKTLRYLRAVARRYRSFPFYSTWAFLANSVARESPVLLLAFFFGPVPAGFFGLGMRVINVPMQMIGDSIAKVAVALIREKKTDTKHVRDAMLGLYGLSLYIATPVILVIFVGGGDIFSFLFGKEWREAGVYAVIVSPLIAVMLCYKVLSIVFDLIERQKNRMYFDVTLLVAQVVPLSAMAALGQSVYATLIAMVLSVLTIYLVGIVHLFGILGVTLRDVIRRTLSDLLYLIPIIVLSVAVAYAEYSAFRTLVLLAISVTVQYVFVFLIRTNRFSRKI